MDFQKSGFPGFQKSGFPGFQKSGFPDFQKIKKLKILKIQIRSVQNVGKVWISRKKILPALFGAIWGIFSIDRKKQKMF